MNHTLFRSLWMALSVSIGLSTIAPIYGQQPRIRRRPPQNAGSRRQRSITQQPQRRVEAQQEARSLSGDAPLSGESVGGSETEISRFNRLAQWVKENKMCLTGTSCPLWLSYSAHFVLGTAIGIGLQMVSQSIVDEYERRFRSYAGRKPREVGPTLIPPIPQAMRTIKQGSRTPDFIASRINVPDVLPEKKDLASPIVLGLVSNALLSLVYSAVELGYNEVLIAGMSRNHIFPFSGPLGIFSLSLGCLLRGIDCTVDQRRRAFFEAGMLLGTSLHSLVKVLVIRALRGYFPAGIVPLDMG